MKTLKIAAASALLALSAAQTAQAADPVFFQAPIQMAGTGCAPGSVSVIGENTSSLTMLFSTYDAGNNSVSGLRRSSCNFAVPVHVPQGYQLSVLTSDWQGYVEGKGRFTRSYGTSLNTRAVNPGTRNLSSPSGTNWQVKDGLMHATAVSGCAGGKFNLRVNTSVQAVGNNSYVAVDTLDMNNKVVFHLKWKRC
ncbi:DUF4360 domain-containing protein [Candidatus Thiothrix anitrata]|jgi:opacity protein-like surface antigen|uniref:DUF4360 domain-containing protein n=1 Tax=Candidatus Thiothrix anitrata TaxID=2823902 RepID=A0ABX7WZQ5_9GAMM|nr:DUF4360 domain-containing protein [Candidatus Thiothrix anitrata]QTR49117.1 DUF4360 domain-containing protein [Candidatus Thiothrix anitrata]